MKKTKRLFMNISLSRRKDRLLIGVFALIFTVIGSYLIFDASAGSKIVSLSTLAPTSEGSGLASSQQYDNVFWWIRDGGASKPGSPREAIYAMKVDSNGKLQNVANGKKFPFYEIANTKNTNWEDIAVDDNNNIWVGDIGANNCGRTNQKLIRIKEPALNRTSKITIDRQYTFKFPDPKSGCKTWNSEAMFWLDGKMYIFAKTSNSPLYRVDFPSGNNGTATLKRLGTLKGGVSNISVSDISADRTKLMVAAHKQTFIYETTKTGLKGDALVKEFLSKQPKYNSRFDCKQNSNNVVEGGAFRAESNDVAFIAENKCLYFAKPTVYGAKADSGGSSGGSGGSDTTKPSLNVSSPSEGSTVSGTITINVDASDDSGIRSVRISHPDGIIRGGTSQGDFGWGSRFNTANIEDGPTTITVVAEDNAGNKRTVNRNIVIDNDDDDSSSNSGTPVVRVTSPTDGATVKKTITIKLDIDNEPGIEKVSIFYDKNNVIRIGTSQGNYGWGSRFNTRNISNGTHTIDVTVEYKSGKVSTTSSEINVKN